jgi:hypothetical protein
LKQLAEAEVEELIDVLEKQGALTIKDGVVAYKL